jgi:hypothetical protein
MPVEAIQERFLTVKQLAERWGVHVKSIPNIEKRGVIKAMRIGRICRFAMSEVLRAEAAGQLAKA